MSWFSFKKYFIWYQIYQMVLGSSHKQLINKAKLHLHVFVWELLLSHVTASHNFGDTWNLLSADDKWSMPIVWGFYAQEVLRQEGMHWNAKENFVTSPLARCLVLCIESMIQCNSVGWEVMDMMDMFRIDKKKGFFLLPGL